MFVNPIPEGFNTLSPHLIVDNGAEAIEFYKKAFDAVETARMPGPGGKLMRAELKIGTSRVMLAEEFGEGPQSAKTLGGSPVVIHMYVEDADAIYNSAVEAGATIKLPIMNTFWGDRYGMITDPFGHSWSIASRQEEVSLQEMGKRAKEYFAGGGK
jgi:uncharacterized glyoxalase superfamily protein PhnB